ncbi:MAG: S-methyl-5*-thioadenosine phosphorylase [Chloroflexi bacterium AL-W]|nr:S-methyl-5*-thioadenosine phosphorylase [Chloroflexi bacterium AL-N1]NOK70934.1 S-methyl-5*-thioadenosine phosphorylase [Chloroflexi bacterium AL-N10]NOK73207.1 S-methyl-5*-thioadenosine phosphorylase [Chloroflexi bacterium AL-N5]NOK80104.1 S-methyl-5*-thioadenosine phosphorylase [Chloroflexi bacterium AL-W]NOK88041.1 S-methyl-5*-thioadenosine phosphorylase [Chloroflexi bacterium AL-N15]
MSVATIGVIGGSGLYAMEGLDNIEQMSLTTPFGAPSDAYIVGSVGEHRVVFLPRHGVGHRLTPSEVPSRANIHGFKQLGVRYLLSISAVGSLREEYVPGDVVIPEQLFDRTKGIRPASFFGEGLVVHVAFDNPFDATLSDILEQAAHAAGATTHRGGTYVCMEGPQFSTCAESEENRRCGHDLIGMTALPEAKLAREAEIAYATLALVTDYDSWHPHHASVTVDMVVQVLQANARLAQEIIRHTIPLIGAGFDSPAHTALATAIITNPSVIPEAKRKQVELLVGKYLDQ